RHPHIEAHRVRVEDLDGVDVFHRATVPLHADSGAFDTQDIELDRFRIDLAAVMEQHPLAQPEDPAGEVLVRLPTLSDARADAALLIDMGEAGVHRRRWMGGVQLIMAVRIEASRIDTRAQLEYTAPWQMPLRRCPVGRETAQGGPHQHGTGRREE